MPGFENARLGTLASWIGVRETWRVIGDYVITGDDVRVGNSFGDAIALGTGPLDTHHSAGGGLSLAVPERPFQIPYRALLPRNVDGLITTGRCVSATREGMAGLRHMGTVMAMGQAAGTAAALAAGQGVSPRAISPSAIQEALTRDGAIITAADAVPFTDPETAEQRTSARWSGGTA